MTKADNIEVAVEAAVHRELRKAVEACRDKYGLYIDDVDIEWIDVLTVGKPIQLIKSIRVITRTEQA